jgi:hypothetical protein
MRMMALAFVLLCSCSYLIGSESFHLRTEVESGNLPCKHSGVVIADATGATAFLAFGTYATLGPLIWQDGTQEGRAFAVLTVLVVGLPSLAVGTLYAVSARHGSAMNDACEREARQWGSATSTSLALQATAAALAGDCKAFATIEAHLCDIDLDEHDTLARDPAITRCTTGAALVASCAARRH